MKNSLKNVSLILKISFLVLVFGLVIILLIKGSLTQGIARTQGERVFENAIPKNAPIKIKIKKEKEQSFKELKNEKWVREFELELTNTGDKPIYLVFIDLITDVKIGDVPLVFSLVYGRVELGDIITKAQPEDVPIKPGETYVFKIHPGQVPAWELSLREKSHPDASSIKAKLEMLSFGDGTGFFIDRPYPKIAFFIEALPLPHFYHAPQCEAQPGAMGTFSVSHKLFLGVCVDKAAQRSVASKYV